MAEPKKRLTASRSGARQSHDSLNVIGLVSCPHCREKILRHHICPNCGYYMGKKVIKLKSDKAKEKAVEEELKVDEESKK